MEEEGGVAPDLAEGGDVVGEDGAAAEGGLERGEAEGLVEGGGEVDGARAEEGEEVGLGEVAEEIEVRWGECGAAMVSGNADGERRGLVGVEGFEEREVLGLVPQAAGGDGLEGAG